MERKEILMIVLIAALLAVSALQTVQLVGISSSQVVSSGTTGLASANPSSGSGNVPANLQNLPQMVGGC